MRLTGRVRFRRRTRAFCISSATSVPGQYGFTERPRLDGAMCRFVPPASSSVNSNRCLRRATHKSLCGRVFLVRQGASQRIGPRDSPLHSRAKPGRPCWPLSIPLQGGGRACTTKSIHVRVICARAGSVIQVIRSSPPRVEVGSDFSPTAHRCRKDSSDRIQAMVEPPLLRRAPRQRPILSGQNEPDRPKNGHRPALLSPSSSRFMTAHARAKCRRQNFCAQHLRDCDGDRADRARPPL